MKDWTGVVLLLILIPLSSVFMGYWPWTNKMPLGQPWLHLLFSHQLHEKLNLQRCEKEKGAGHCSSWQHQRPKRTNRRGCNRTRKEKSQLPNSQKGEASSWALSLRLKRTCLGFCVKNNKIHLYCSYKFSQLFYTCTSLSHLSAQGRQPLLCCVMWAWSLELFKQPKKFQNSNQNSLCLFSYHDPIWSDGTYPEFCSWSRKIQDRWRKFYLFIIFLHTLTQFTHMATGPDLLLGFI